jgi:hypothetical protein
MKNRAFIYFLASPVAFCIGYALINADAGSLVLKQAFEWGGLIFYSVSIFAGATALIAGIKQVKKGSQGRILNLIAIIGGGLITATYLILIAIAIFGDITYKPEA